MKIFVYNYREFDEAEYFEKFSNKILMVENPYYKRYGSGYSLLFMLVCGGKALCTTLALSD